ncbi:MAG: hypothetical protein F6J93_18315 [Oscillatoria sp. SIO1A7]|nr:hypothetical protein [Oscillatoria sp. SIO1A7]
MSSVLSRFLMAIAEFSNLTTKLIYICFSLLLVFTLSRFASSLSSVLSRFLMAIAEAFFGT